MGAQRELALSARRENDRAEQTPHRFPIVFALAATRTKRVPRAIAIDPVEYAPRLQLQLRFQPPSSLPQQQTRSMWQHPTMRSWRSACGGGCGAVGVRRTTRRCRSFLRLFHLRLFQLQTARSHTASGLKQRLQALRKRSAAEMAARVAELEGELACLQQAEAAQSNAAAHAMQARLCPSSRKSQDAQY